MLLGQSVTPREVKDQEGRRADKGVVIKGYYWEGLRETVSTPTGGHACQAALASLE